MSKAALSIYMDDHYAMLSGELELVHRVKKENPKGELEKFLVDYEHELQSQRNLLEALLASQGHSPSMAKQALTWVAEKIGRLKPNDGGSSYTDLARLLELEILLATAQARLLMWRTLNRVFTDRDADMEKLKQARKASDELVKSLKPLHREAEQRAFPKTDS
ncbi:hypothetical protein Pan97_24860 [Bremerella volcania]|uniref:Uncharacterized protein n=1 Tax=Bremerella volcania TaxID=2527984 RepID=A0A518C8C0_9BACT|nr:hypothetical protein [Bremerella volcania]QDU75454.1 hypothetical protein Pan97_24860 [Bremerella volcania]